MDANYITIGILSAMALAGIPLSPSRCPLNVLDSAVVLLRNSGADLQLRMFPETREAESDAAKTRVGMMETDAIEQRSQ